MSDRKTQRLKDGTTLRGDGVVAIDVRNVITLKAGVACHPMSAASERGTENKYLYVFCGRVVPWPTMEYTV